MAVRQSLRQPSPHSTTTTASAGSVSRSSNPAQPADRRPGGRAADRRPRGPTRDARRSGGMHTGQHIRRRRLGGPLTFHTERDSPWSTTFFRRPAGRRAPRHHPAAKPPQSGPKANVSATVATQPYRHPRRDRSRMRRVRQPFDGGPLNQAYQRVVSESGLFELHQMPGPRDDEQFAGRPAPPPSPGSERSASARLDRRRRPFKDLRQRRQAGARRVPPGRAGTPPAWQQECRESWFGECDHAGTGHGRHRRTPSSGSGATRTARHPGAVHQLRRVTRRKPTASKAGFCKISPRRRPGQALRRRRYERRADDPVGPAVLLGNCRACDKIVIHPSNGRPQRPAPPEHPA